MPCFMKPTGTTLRSSADFAAKMKSVARGHMPRAASSPSTVISKRPFAASTTCSRNRCPTIPLPVTTNRVCEPIVFDSRKTKRRQSCHAALPERLERMAALPRSGDESGQCSGRRRCNGHAMVRADRNPQSGRGLTDLGGARGRSGLIRYGARYGLLHEHRAATVFIGDAPPPEGSEAVAWPLPSPYVPSAMDRAIASHPSRRSEHRACRHSGRGAARRRLRGADGRREMHGLMRRIVETDHDVIFIDLENPNRDVLEQTFQVSRSGAPADCDVRGPGRSRIDSGGGRGGVGARRRLGLHKERVRRSSAAAVQSLQRREPAARSSSA